MEFRPVLLTILLPHVRQTHGYPEGATEVRGQPGDEPLAAQREQRSRLARGEHQCAPLRSRQGKHVCKGVCDESHSDDEHYFA